MTETRVSHSEVGRLTTSLCNDYPSPRAYLGKEVNVDCSCSDCAEHCMTAVTRASHSSMDTPKLESGESG